MGKTFCSAKDRRKLRTNPRKIWYQNVDSVMANGDGEALFHLKRPQPALIALIASGYSPVYPPPVSRCKPYFLAMAPPTLPPSRPRPGSYRRLPRSSAAGRASQSAA
jgi:hypothetical protein